MNSFDPTARELRKRIGWVMDESSIDEEREGLNRRRQEITSRLQSLAGQDGTLDAATLETRR